MAKKENKNIWQYVSLVLILVVVFLLFFDVNIAPRSADSQNEVSESVQAKTVIISKETIAPTKGIVLEAEWGGLGKQLVESGAIDITKLESLYSNRGGLDEYQKSLVYNDNNKNLVINSENSKFVLNLLWALGLANQSTALDEGPMQKNGDAGRYAATGGWSLSTGNPMDHYSKYDLMKLTSAQQSLVNDVAKNIYRPCCNNSTYFPDCNHGMAMLGLLELLASQGASEADMYREALKVNSYWFPGNYTNIAQYFQKQGIDWKDVDPKLVLGKEYSSASGYKRVLSSIQPQSSGGGGGCSV